MQSVLASTRVVVDSSASAVEAEVLSSVSAAEVRIASVEIDEGQWLCKHFKHVLKVGMVVSPKVAVDEV